MLGVHNKIQVENKSYHNLYNVMKTDCGWLDTKNEKVYGVILEENILELILINKKSRFK